MDQAVRKGRDDEWLDYYKQFRYFSAEAVRDGCQPRIMEQVAPVQRSIVLVHGLTDSPYFLTAIGEYFFIPEDVGVPHASVVLKDPVYAINAAAGDAPLEKANPLFQDMMEAIAAIG